MTRAHARKKLWRLGSNPPLVLLAHGRLRRSTSGGTATASAGSPRIWRACLRDGAFVWHWSGPRLRGSRTASRVLWPHVRDARCLLGLPGVPPNVVRFIPVPAAIDATTTAHASPARSAARSARRRRPRAAAGSRCGSARAGRPRVARVVLAPRLRFFGALPLSPLLRKGRNAGTCARRVVVAPAPKTP